MNNIILIFFILLVYFLFNKLNKANENFTNNKVLTFPKPQNWNELSFTDKLKIYGNNLTKEHSFYADKLRVKNYINSLNIDELYTPKTIKVLDKNNPILDLSSLSSNCVIKSNNSSGPIIIIKEGKIDLIKPKLSYDKWIKEAIKPHITKHEKHYTYIEPEIFVEEYLKQNDDYKFYCFNGKVKSFHIDSDRFNGHCRNLYDGVSNNLLPYTLTFKNCKNITLPDNIEKMKEIAENLSQQFEFIRVDLYNVDSKIYFGELTFVPGAGNETYTPSTYDKILGSYWK